MKVLHVIPSIAWRYGGPTAAARSMCAELARIPGLEVELATTDADGPTGRLRREDFPSDYPIHFFPRTATEQWKYSRQLGVWLRSNVNRFDVIHIHALWSYAANAAARAARRAGVPYVVRPAGMLSDYTFQHGAWKKRVYWQLVEQSTVFGAAAFHATSSGERGDICRIRPDANVFVIPNGVDDDAWTAAISPGGAAESNEVPAEKRPTVLFLSRLHPKKGIVDLLLPAWAKLELDALLMIAGGVDAHAPAHESQVHEAIDRLGLAGRVKLLGAIPAEQRWKLYDAADLFVLPSHSENFGIVVAEAMARGCPVIVTDQVQSCELVRRANAGMVIPFATKALTGAITEMLSDSTARKFYSESGRRYAKEHLRWARIAKRIHDEYRDLIAGRDALANRLQFTA